MPQDFVNTRNHTSVLPGTFWLCGCDFGITAESWVWSYNLPGAAQDLPPGRKFWDEGSVGSPTLEVFFSRSTNTATQIVTSGPGGAGQPAAVDAQHQFYQPLYEPPEEIGMVAFNDLRYLYPPTIAKYQLLIDHALQGGYYAAGSIISEGDGSVPVGWVPTLDVQPLNDAATLALWNAGPRNILSAARTETVRVYKIAPTIYWVPIAAGSNVCKLIGTTMPLDPKAAA